MKISIIKASAASGFKKYKKTRGGLPQNIHSLAAATPKHIEIELIDETVDCKVNYRTSSDLIVIMFSTPDAIRGYRHADKFRSKGKTVILGGLHPSFLPDEALQHADSVMIGESENIWNEVLKDFQNRELKQRYKSVKAVDLSTIKPYRTDLIGLKRYDWIWTTVVSRGCPFKCDFCTVNKFFHSIQYRPIPDIIKEIKHCGTEWIELKADNLTIDRKYCLELFKAIKPLGINWSTATDIRIANDEELLSAAAESGLNYVLVGIETPSGSALKGSGKNFVKTDQVYHQIKKLHDYGVIVDASALFGFDTHTVDIFEETLNFFQEIEVDVCESVLVIPFPGTALFQQLEKEGRILTRDWSKYDGAHVVYQPKILTPQELEAGWYWFYKKWNAWGMRSKRKKRQIQQLGRENANYISSTF